MLNNDERRKELLDKANSLIDKISESMRLVENVEAAKEKFLRPDTKLSLEMPTEDPDYKDVFKLDEIFDEDGTDKIKAFVLTELELLEEESLKLLEAAGFHDLMKAPEPEPQRDPKEEPLPFDDWEDIEEKDPEDDSDMKIVIPDKVRHSTKALPQKTVEQINKLVSEGAKPAEIAKKTGVSYNSAVRYSNKFMETVPNGKTDSGRSVSSRC